MVGHAALAESFAMCGWTEKALSVLAAIESAGMRPTFVRFICVIWSGYD